VKCDLMYLVEEERLYRRRGSVGVAHRSSASMRASDSRWFESGLLFYFGGKREERFADDANTEPPPPTLEILLQAPHSVIQPLQRPFRNLHGFSTTSVTFSTTSRPFAVTSASPSTRQTGVVTEF
jgi:hypothetical protein